MLRMKLSLSLLLVCLSCYSCSHTRATSLMATSEARSVGANSGNKPRKVDFTAQIRPILEGKCQPCHFTGGKVYERLPFDRPETIRTLGEKLFTRIKNEDERRLIREFLSQP